MSWGDLTDSEWRILDPLLPDRGERGPAIPDKRRTVNGILWVLRTGAPWRDMPERYGNWNSVFIRFTRWSKLGVWDAAFETLASLGPAADTEHAIDSTIVRAHQHAAGVKGGIKIRKRYTRWASEGRRDGKLGGLSPQSRRHIHRILKAALGRAVEQQVIARNPCDVLARHLPKVERREMMTLTAEQAAGLLEAINASASIGRCSSLWRLVCDAARF